MSQRKYTVKLQDEDGKMILKFTGDVKEKLQSSGRLGIGDVKETLVVSRFAITVGKKYQYDICKENDR